MTVLEQLGTGLTVSCQAYPGEPMRDSRTTAQVAQSVVRGGAVAIRVQGLEDIVAVKAAVDVPVVGLWKDGESDVFITPTLEHALAVAEAGADIIAIDGTQRPRPDGLTVAQTISEFKKKYPDRLIMADCSSKDDALIAEAAGADIVGTTLAGYTSERPKTVGPDYELITEILSVCKTPLIVEGRVHSPAQAQRAIELGAYGVCVGTAITHPSTITGWFSDAVATARTSR